MKKFLKAEMWDKTQYLFRNYYDRMMHCVLYYDSLINADLLKEAIAFQVENVPVLHSRYHNNPLKPYWTVNDYNVENILTVKEVDNLEAEVDKFVTQCIPIKKNVQVQIGLLNCKGKSTFIMVANHMCFDGGDFKYFVTQLCSNYTKLTLGDKNLTIKHGSRSYDMIYSGLSKEDKKTAKGLFRNVSQVAGARAFPLTEKRDSDTNRVIRRTVSADRFNAMRAAGKTLGLTINDVMLAVYFRSLFELGNINPKESYTVQSMVDLRRHLKQGGAETGLTNHTGFMSCTINGIGADMKETLKKVSEAMAFNKSDKFLGLYGLPLLNLAYTILPHGLSEFAIKLGYKNPLVGMSNIGQIKIQEYKMGDVSLFDGWYTGAIKGKPYMQLAFTTLNGAVTFTVAVCGNSDDDRIINRFLDLVERNIDEASAMG